MKYFSSTIFTGPDTGFWIKCAQDYCYYKAKWKNTMALLICTFTSCKERFSRSSILRRVLFEMEIHITRLTCGDLAQRGGWFRCCDNCRCQMDWIMEIPRLVKHDFLVFLWGCFQKTLASASADWLRKIPPRRGQSHLISWWPRWINKIEERMSVFLLLRAGTYSSFPALEQQNSTFWTLGLVY